MTLANSHIVSHSGEAKRGDKAPNGHSSSQFTRDHY